MKKLIAHRGNNNHSYKENSKEALLNCLNKSYISGVELDIRVTKDKKFIIYHDPFILLDNGNIKMIKNMTLNQLKRENVGTNKNNQKISSLKQFLNEVKNDKIILIEIKDETSDYKMVVDKLVKLISKYINVNIYLCSFNYNIMKYLEEKELNFKKGLIVGNIINKKKEVNSFDFISINIKSYDKLNKKQLFVWTVNKKEELKKLDNDVFIITDKAYYLKNYLV